MMQRIKPIEMARELVEADKMIQDRLGSGMNSNFMNLYE